MKNAKIVLVAEWDGWCGACAADRPLVLTRTGRQRLRTWLTGAADDSRPLVLTCRLCGTGVDVPLEQDDPPVVVAEQEPAWQPAEQAGSAGPETVAPVTVATTSADDLAGGRRAVAQALAGLLAQRSAEATAPLPVPIPQQQPVVVPVPLAAPALPLQRTPSSGGLAELQLLADGIDLLSSGHP